MFELKFYKNLTAELWKFMANKKSMLNEFIGQAKESADVYNRHWCLIFKCNFRETMMLTSMTHLSKAIPEGVLIKRASGSSYLIPFNEFLQTDSKKVLAFLAKQ